MELKPCSKCGRRVSDLDIRQGDGVSLKGRFYCRKCALEMDLEIKSDYSAVGPFPGKQGLSDTQFFKRAGKLFENIDQRKRGKPRRGRIRSKDTMARGNRRARLAKRSGSLKDANFTVYMVGSMLGIIIILIFIIIYLYFAN